ncbi:hypothetical protein AtubIFM57258_004843 [Aspergillus tubingensis]|nr:hypothetical protein AtubIFM57258_004843 [Aspergillus tubingensis]
MFGTLVSTQSESEPFISHVIRPPFESDRELKHLACLACRTKKLKCTGERTGCQRCLDRGLPCEYQEANPHRGRRPRGASLNNNKNNGEVEDSTDHSSASAAPKNSDGSRRASHSSEAAKARIRYREEKEQGGRRSEGPGSLNGGTPHATSDLGEDGLDPELLTSMHEPATELGAEVQLSDIPMTPDDDLSSLLPDFGHTDFASNDVNQDLLFLSQLAASSTPELVNPSYPPNPSPAMPRLSSSTSRLGIPGISQLASSPSIANLHMPSCTCLQSTLTLYESIRAVQWRAQCGASAGLSREMAHLILKACKLALNQCHRLIGCSSCKREPLFVMLLCSVCDQCLTCFETFHDSHQRRLRSRSMTSSTGSSFVNASEARSEMDQLGEIVQLANLPFGDVPVLLDDEDDINMTCSLLTTRVASMVSLLRLLGPIIDGCGWRTHHDTFSVLQKRCQGLAYTLQTKSKAR